MCWVDCVNSSSNVCDDMRHMYVVETSRSLQERSEEHVTGSIRLDPRNFITKHWLERHETLDDPPVFTFKVNKVHNDPLSREIDEAVKIQMITKHVKILNSKSEWNSNKISRLCVEKSVWKQKKDAEEALKKQAEFNSAAKDFKASKNVPSFNQAIEKLKLKIHSLGAGMAGTGALPGFKMAPDTERVPSNTESKRWFDYFRF